MPWTQSLDLIEKQILNSLNYYSEDQRYPTIAETVFTLKPEMFSTPVRQNAFSWALQAHRDGKGFSTVNLCDAPQNVASELISDGSALPVSLRTWQAMAARIEGEWRHNEQARLLAAASQNVRNPTDRDRAISDAMSLDRVAEAHEYRSAAQLVGESYATGISGEQVGRRLTTGFEMFDSSIPDLHEGGLMILGARTSSGKSAMCVSLGWQLAMNHIPSGYISCEDNYKKIGTRLTSFIAGVPASQLNDVIQECLTQDTAGPTGFVEDAIKDPRLQLQKVSHGPTDIESVVQRMRTLVLKEGARVLFVDYIQAITERGNNDDMRIKIADWAARIKHTAGDLGVPVVLASQLKRTESIRPYMSDLKESGTLEEIADWVILLWRRDGESGPTQGVVAKNKNGPVGATFECGWAKSGALFSSITSVQLSSSPQQQRHTFAR